MFGATDTINLHSKTRFSLKPGSLCGSEESFLKADSRVCSNAGFTLTELVLMVIIVAVLVTTVSMRSGWLTSGPNVKLGVDQVLNDLRFLQSRSMAVYGTTVPATLRSVTFPASGTTYNLGGQVKNLPSGVTLSINPGLTVTFNSLGEYNSTVDAILTLNAGGQTRTVKIYAVSGDVEAF